MGNLIPRWHKSINEIEEFHWKSLTREETIPFYQWSWLMALEKSESIALNKGWQPLHLCLWRSNQPIAIALLYLKFHSYGEFIFDHPFVRLAEELRLNYYPKLVGMSPLSPVEGYRFFIMPDEDESNITTLMLQIIDDFAIKNGILSCNFLYVDPKWIPLAEKSEYSIWLNQKSLWKAEGKKTFSDYLSAFNANQRRNIKRERKSIHDAGLNISTIHGDEIDLEIMQRMYELYARHCDLWGVWGSKYLSQSFFQELSKANYRNNLILFSAYKQNPKDPIAMSLCVKHEKMLWGRYWGSKEKIDCLHFELCYYTPIAWALENGIESFDPGAGGKHKGRRGFVNKPHTSMHRWYHKTMDELIKAWLPRANQLMLDEIQTLNNELPFNSDYPLLSITE